MATGICTLLGITSEESADLSIDIEDFVFLDCFLRRSDEEEEEEEGDLRLLRLDFLFLATEEDDEEELDEEDELELEELEDVDGDRLRLLLSLSFSLPLGFSSIGFFEISSACCLTSWFWLFFAGGLGERAHTCTSFILIS
jgi:hypothetical protein